MKILLNPPKQNWLALTQRPQTRKETLTDLVIKVFNEVKIKGDSAVINYSKQFDAVELTNISVSKETIANAEKSISNELKNAIQIAKSNIQKFHIAQKEKVNKIETTLGVQCWRESRAIDSVGLYIPGGTAPLFSTVLMLGIPAMIAGCKNIVLCTPPNKNGEIDNAILYTAALIGITNVFCVGGIQAIAALTYGTETIPKVKKIFGPGNQYVTAAKQYAQNNGVAIDMPAGPSEVLVIADNTANASFIAADLLSQAEHGADSQVILLTDSFKIAEAVNTEIDFQINELPRKALAAEALKNSKTIVLQNLTECIDWSNLYAPEHLILASDTAETMVYKITNAGSVFIGHYSCEAVGDYASGTNHTLPTNGFAANYSGVSIDSFVKKITFQQLSVEGIINIGPTVEVMAEAEQLLAHKNAVTVRLRSLGG